MYIKSQDDGRLEKEGEREKWLRMPSGFLNCTTIWMGCCWKQERKPGLGREKVIHLVLRQLEEPRLGP